MTNDELDMERVAHEFFGYADRWADRVGFWSSHGDFDYASKCVAHAIDCERTGIHFLCRALRII